MTGLGRTTHLPQATGVALVGLVASLSLFLGGGLWAARVEIAAAVVAPGTLSPSETTRQIQTSEGGIVAEIAVQEGDLVEAGALLIRLDDSDLKSELAVVESQLFEIAVRSARLAAEVSDSGPPDMTGLPEFETVQAEWAKAQISGQAELYDVHQAARALEAQATKENRRQLQARIDGLVAERSSILQRLRLLRAQTDTQAALRDRGLARAADAAGLQQALFEAEGQLARLTAEIAETRARIA